MPKAETHERDTPQLPPGPRLPAFLQALNWTFRPGAFAKRCRQRYGDIFMLHLEMRAKPIVFIGEPRLAAEIMKADALRGVPGSRVQIEPLFGSEAISFLDGEAHKGVRQAMLPPFRGRHVEHYREMILAGIDQEIDSWPEGRAFPLRKRLQKMALGTIVDIVFGTRNPVRREQMIERMQRMSATLGTSTGGLLILLPHWFRKIGETKLRSWRREFDELVLEEISARRNGSGGEDYADGLAHLMAAGEEGAAALGDNGICDQVMGLFLAGHATSAATMAWAIDYLLHSPEALERLHFEMENSEDGGKRYLDAVVNETLRLSPPLATTRRHLVRPAEVGGYTVPGDTVICISNYLMHRRSDLYSEPDAFRPERFLDASPAADIWWSFGAGSRYCLGANFARYQINWVLRRIFERTKLQAATSRPESMRKRGIVFVPRHGTRVIMTDRHPAQSDAPVAGTPVAQ